MGQKRRRIALSCVDCRRRKVKCDRTYPQCVRCQKGGYGEKCIYVRHTGAGSQEGTPTPEDDRNRRSVTKESWADEASQYEHTAQNNEARAHQRLHGASKMASTENGPNLVNSQERKIAQIFGKLMELETKVYAAGGKPTSTEANLGILNPMGHGINRDPNYYSDKYTLADHEKVLLRGKSFQTQYFGPSNSFAILLQFEDLSKFVREILLSLPSLANHKLAMAKIREKEKMAAKAQYDISIESLINMVPERAMADRLIYQYLDTIETTYRIVHVPTFLKDYEALWRAPRDARPDFVVQLLVAIAMMYALVPGGEEGYVGRSSVLRETATYWINVANYWLESQSQKHVALVNYQLHVQLWIAKWINCIKVKRFWTDSGLLVRRFMAAGLHREPSLLCGKINTFDCEMRRRLWYTVLELDLQATVDRGITPTIGPMDWDTIPPRNIDDESFSPDSTEPLPDAKPRGQFTRTSFLSWATESLPMRIELLQKINSIRNALDHDTIYHYDDKLRALIDDIPLDQWKDAVPDAPDSSNTSPNAQYLPTPSSFLSMSWPGTLSPLIAMTLAQAFTREYLTILHQPFATNLVFKSRHFHSRVARRYACLYTVLLYNPQISRSVSGPSGVTNIDPRFHLSEAQRRFFACFREDYVRAALSLAHDFTVSTDISSNPFYVRVQDDNRVIEIIEAAVKMLADRVLHMGQGFHSYWITSSALSFVHSKQNPEVSRKTFAHAAADRLVKMHSIVIDGQVERARRLMVPAPGAEGLPDGGGSPADLPDEAPAEITRTMEEITTMDGARGLQKRASEAGLTPLIGSTNLSTSANTASASMTVAAVNPGFVSGLPDMSGGMISFDQGPEIGVTAPTQDLMFGLENMDWNMLMNTDPTDFMGGGWYYPT